MNDLKLLIKLCPPDEHQPVTQRHFGCGPGLLRAGKHHGIPPSKLPVNIPFSLTLPVQMTGSGFNDPPSLSLSKGKLVAVAPAFLSTSFLIRQYTNTDRLSGKKVNADSNLPLLPRRTHILAPPSGMPGSYSYNRQIINLKHLGSLCTGFVSSQGNKVFLELFEIYLTACDVGNLNLNGGSFAVMKSQ